MTNVLNYIGLISQLIADDRQTLRAAQFRALTSSTPSRDSIDDVRGDISAWVQWVPAGTALPEMPARGTSNSEIRNECTLLLSMLANFEAQVMGPVITSLKAILAADTHPAATLSVILSSASSSNNGSLQAAARIVNEFIKSTRMQAYINMVASTGDDTVNNANVRAFARQYELNMAALGDMFNRINPANVLANEAYAQSINYLDAKTSDYRVVPIDTYDATLFSAGWTAAGGVTAISTQGVIESPLKRFGPALRTMLNTFPPASATTQYIGFYPGVDELQIQIPRLLTGAAGSTTTWAFAEGSCGYTWDVTGASAEGTTELVFMTRTDVGSTTANPAVIAVGGALVNTSVTATWHYRVGAGAWSTLTVPLSVNGGTRIRLETRAGESASIRLSGITAVRSGTATAGDYDALLLAVAGHTTISTYIGTSSPSPNAYAFDDAQGIRQLAYKTTFSQAAGNMQPPKDAQSDDAWRLVESALHRGINAYSDVLAIMASDSAGQYDNGFIFAKKYAALFGATSMPVETVYKLLRNPFAWFSSDNSAYFAGRYQRFWDMIKRDVMSLAEMAASDKSAIAEIADAVYN